MIHSIKQDFNANLTYTNIYVNTTYHKWWRSVWLVY